MLCYCYSIFIPEEVVMGRGGVVLGAGEAMDAYEAEANTSGCSLNDQYCIVDITLKGFNSEL
jgi:hypothetical protein